MGVHGVHRELSSVDGLRGLSFVTLNDPAGRKQQVACVLDPDTHDGASVQDECRAPPSCSAAEARPGTTMTMATPERTNWLNATPSPEDSGSSFSFLAQWP